MDVHSKEKPKKRRKVTHKKKKETEEGEKIQHKNTIKTNYLLLSTP